MIYDFLSNDVVAFNHEQPSQLPNDELLQLAQMNETPPMNLIGEIGRRGLQGEFRRLWQDGLHCPNN